MKLTTQTIIEWFLIKISSVDVIKHVVDAYGDEYKATDIKRLWTNKQNWKRNSKNKLTYDDARDWSVSDIGETFDDVAPGCVLRTFYNNKEPLVDNFMIDVIADPLDQKIVAWSINVD